MRAGEDGWVHKIKAMSRRHRDWGDETKNERRIWERDKR